MEPGAVLSLPPAATRVVTHDDMVSFRIIRIQYNNFWGVRRVVQRTTIVPIGNINDSWKWIRVISSYLGGGGGGYHQW